MHLIQFEWKGWFLLRGCEIETETYFNKCSIQNLQTRKVG